MMTSMSMNKTYPCSCRRLRSNADDFQIFAVHRGAAGPGLVMSRPERLKIPAQSRLPLGVKRSKGPVNRSIVEAKEFHDLRGRKRIAEEILPPCQAERGQSITEPFLHRGFIPPE